MTFTKAERRKAFIKLAITGTAGSGKTYSALLLARGLVGKKGRIAVIDTENGSATLYSDLTDFDHCEIRPRTSGSFHYIDFIEKIKEAEKAGYDCVIIDSASHLWQGILDSKTELDKRGGNSFANWAESGKHFNTAIQQFLQSQLHVISCIRSKTEYVIEANEKGKQAPRKIGLAPVMRDGIEYEFTTVFDVAIDHTATVSKDRTSLFVHEGSFQITEDTGKKIADWIDGGADVLDKHGIYAKVRELAANGGLLQSEVIAEVQKYGKDKMLDLDDESFMKVAMSLGVA
jgi:hypothetical protein